MPAGRRAVVVSALFESLQGNALMQVAKSLPRHVAAEDVIQEIELGPYCTFRPCSVWIGRRQLNVAVATELPPAWRWSSCSCSTDALCRPTSTASSFG